MKPEEKYKKLIKETKEFFEKQRCHKAAIGLSGGIDSSLTAKIAVDAIGKENITGLIMPEKTSRPESAEYAKELAEQLGIKVIEVNINEFFRPFWKLLGWEQNRASKTNIKPRIRMTILYNYANAHNTLVLGTSNKTEIVLGYFTKHGDGATDFVPLGDLYKTEVFEIAKIAGIPEKIISRKPSAELEENQTDEKDLGMSYKEVDKILEKKEQGTSEKKLIKEFGEKAKKILERIKANKHKTEPTGKIRFK
ncbi:NAD+ synthase [Candidatus Micrarchaeota archaeon]|nr:NAD+ synthase [Candidatus Micrarchaeota archaeon]MBU2476075.1 NAD+ synthase [Candidatus Micrarchaeota archaeon]